MATATTPDTAQRVVLYDADWKMYERLLRAFAERPRVRLTYDRGVLEIMSPLKIHERHSEIVSRFVTVLTEELELPIEAGGSTTLRRRRKQKGLEPDKCFWIASEALVRGKDDLDLRRDPPPDLALEVDATRSSLNRMAIYAKLGVPEVWRLERSVLTFHILDKGKYVESPRSLAFPMVTPADLSRWFPLTAALDQNAVVRQFRDWVRQQPGAGPTRS